MTTTTKMETFRGLFEAGLREIAAKTDPTSRCLILSGGVDTCAILAAASTLGMTFAGAVTVCCGDDSPDEGFARAWARHHELPHHIVKVPADELIDRHLAHCIEHLHCFDGMTLRNSLVIAAAFHKVRELGFTDAIVGDGADELLGGYSFTWGSADDPALWKEKRDRMCRQWTFATEALARSFGLKQHGPYMYQPLVDWVLETVERSDCIGTRPIRLTYGGEPVDHITGKILLREAYETVSSWRRKDPIEVGSGATVIGHDEFWKDRVSDEEFQEEVQALKADGYRIQTKENLVNFRVFERCFGRFGERLPDKKRLPIGQGCVGCCFEIGEQMFCHVCGSYPAPRHLAEKTEH